MSVVEGLCSLSVTHRSSRLLLRGAGGTRSTHFRLERAHRPHGYTLSHFTLREKQRSHENLTTGRFWAMITAPPPEAGPEDPSSRLDFSLGLLYEYKFLPRYAWLWPSVCDWCYVRFNAAQDPSFVQDSKEICPSSANCDTISAFSPCNLLQGFRTRTSEVWAEWHNYISPRSNAVETRPSPHLSTHRHYVGPHSTRTTDSTYSLYRSSYTSIRGNWASLTNQA